jgi:hypothetical protein
MPNLIEVDATVGGTSSNSYVDLEYANSYWEQHWDVNSASQWNALSDPQKSSLLVQACRIIETLRFTYPVDPTGEFRLEVDYAQQQIRSVKNCDSRPQKYVYNQKLQFPRTFEAYLEGEVYVPDTIKIAQCEQCVYMLNVDTSVLTSRLQGVISDSLSVGGIQISQRFAPGGATGTLVSPVALQYCKPLMIRGNVRLQRS